MKSVGNMIAQLSALLGTADLLLEVKLRAHRLNFEPDLINVTGGIAENAHAPVTAITIDDAIPGRHRHADFCCIVLDRLYSVNSFLHYLLNRFGTPNAAAHILIS
jgi:hypothetical protein